MWVVHRGFRAVTLCCRLRLVILLRVGGLAVRLEDRQVALDPVVLADLTAAAGPVGPLDDLTPVSEPTGPLEDLAPAPRLTAPVDLTARAPQAALVVPVASLAPAAPN